jgi:hypothetical protein
VLGAPRWNRTRVTFAAAAVLIVAQLGVRWALLADSYFRQDDYEFIARAAEQLPGWEYLMRSHGGQLMPGGFAIAWLLTRFSAYDWGVTGAVTLLMQALASLAVLRMLRVLFGDRPAILIPLAIYLFTPMTLTSTAWWAAALNSIPLQIAIAMAVAAHVRYVRTGEGGYAWRTAGWILFGLAFFVKAAVLPFLLLAVTSAYLLGNEGAWPRTLMITLRRHWRAWALYGALLPVYALVYALQLVNTSRTDVGAPSGTAISDFASAWLGKTAPVTMVGGPGRWFPGSFGDYAVAAPPQAMVAVAWAVIIAVVALTVWFRRRAWRAWPILIGWLVAADMMPVVLGRMPALAGNIYGIETRYLADAAPVLALCLALACIPLRGEQAPYRRPLPVGWLHPSTVGVLIAVQVSVALWSTFAYLDKTSPKPAQDYLGNARATLAIAPNDAVVFDRSVPQYLTWQMTGPYAQTSHLLAPLARPELRAAIRSPRPGEKPFIFDDQGRLRPAAVVGTPAGLPGKCWPSAQGGYTLPIAPPRTGDRWVVELSYLSGTPGRVQVSYGGPAVEVPLRSGLRRVYIPIQGRGPNVVIKPESAIPGLCVGGVTVGSPVAAP